MLKKGKERAKTAALHPLFYSLKMEIKNLTRWRDHDINLDKQTN
jgi:hypothetical protein